MTRDPRLRRAPLWFELALVVLAGLVVRQIWPDAGEADTVRLAFWGWIVALANWIWTGVQVVGHVTLSALAWSVSVLWSAIQVFGDGIREAALALMHGFKGAWGFLRDVYTHVLKPAWQKFWSFVDWARHELEDLLKPLIHVLQRIRAEFLKWYDRFARPILDSIGLARKILGIFKTLGFEWAAKLDAKLGDLDGWLSARFAQVLGEINKVINIVNRVVTADGLFQRLALVRSIERDIRYVSRAFMNWRSKPLTDADFVRLRKLANARDVGDVTRDTAEVMSTGGGFYGATASEIAAQWRIYLRG